MVWQLQSAKWKGQNPFTTTWLDSGNPTASIHHVHGWNNASFKNSHWKLQTCPYLHGFHHMHGWSSASSKDTPLKLQPCPPTWSGSCRVPSGKGKPIHYNMVGLRHPTASIQHVHGWNNASFKDSHWKLQGLPFENSKFVHPQGLALACWRVERAKPIHNRMVGVRGSNCKHPPCAWMEQTTISNCKFFHPQGLALTHWQVERAKPIHNRMVGVRGSNCKHPPCAWMEQCIFQGQPLKTETLPSMYMGGQLQIGRC